MSQALPVPRGEVGNIRVVKDPSNQPTVPRGRSPLQYAEVPPNDARFQVVGAIVHLALSLLESEPGKYWLVKTGTRIIEERRADRERHLFGNRDLREMPQWANSFLQEMRMNFPDI